MANTIIVGAQWGDEGKGKIVDYLTGDADVVVRAQGGNNAGHTVIQGGTKYVLHLMPSGILWPNKLNVIGNGVVMDPSGLLAEMEKLRQQGISISPDNLLISETAHLVLPYHRGMDLAREAGLGDRKIGTTGRGIGPAYADKINRVGIRTAELRNMSVLLEKLAARVADHNVALAAAGVPTISFEETAELLLKAAEVLVPHLTNTALALHQAVKAGKTLLFEGAQGTFLDIDHGTYPFVTSSNTTSGGALTGSGVPPRAIDRVVGVAKAYTTRVGSGPFPTENDELGDMLHNMGREFGATTGRARRCGWLDFVLLRHAAMVSGIDEFAITNLDGLDGLPTIKICVAYQYNGQRLEYPPLSAEELALCEPVYEEMPGWLTPIDAIRKVEDLPANARAYLARITAETGAPVTYIGVGPDRIQTLVG